MNDDSFTDATAPDGPDVIAETRTWLEQIVIGLNL
ncbi:MAG TPA: DUF1415 domain-containing protein, partial [Stenotrophomonas sp.]|nr:DUF1415 domain-containing protein [Stenotrophomonas sp.]